MERHCGHAKSGRDRDQAGQFHGVEQREHRYDVLLAQAEDKGVDVRGMEFYLDCFRYGCPPHGGFGLGLARTVMSGLQLPTVRDATFLFRGPNRLRP